MPELATERKAVERPLIFQGWGVVAILEGRKTQTRRIAKFKPLPQERGINLSATTLKLGNYMTGHPESGYVLYSMRGGCWNQVTERLFCPYGVPGDRLWVRETFTLQSDADGDNPAFTDGRPLKEFQDAEESRRWYQPHYRATDPPPDLCCENPHCKCCRDGEPGPHWKSSMFMPRWASRLLLEITEVRVERVQEITEEDAQVEGVKRQFRTVLMRPDGGTDYHIPFSYRGGYANEWNRINAKRGFGWDTNPWVWVLTF